MTNKKIRILRWPTTSRGVRRDHDHARPTHGVPARVRCDGGDDDALEFGKKEKGI